MGTKLAVRPGKITPLHTPRVFLCYSFLSLLVPIFVAMSLRTDNITPGIAR